MGQVFAKFRELLTQIISISCCKRGKNVTRTSKPTNLEVREQVITIPDAHIVTIPDENEDQNRRKVTEEFRFNLVNGEAAGSSNWLRTQPNKRDSWTKHYCSSHKILLVGEGDFSFSACLAKAFGSATNMVATSLDSQNFLSKQYRHAMSNINYLVNRGCFVIHDLDATEMANNHFLNTFRFDRIIYNFPWAGFFKDCPRETALKFHRNLVSSFMKNAKEVLEEDGEIHITHKAYGFYLEWNLEKLARQSGLRLIEDVEFKLSDYPGYGTKLGCGGNGYFNCFRSRTYKFGLN